MNIERFDEQNLISENIIDGNGQSLDSTLSLIDLVYISILLSSLWPGGDSKRNMLKINYQANLTCSVSKFVSYSVIFDFNTTLWG